MIRDIVWACIVCGTRDALDDDGRCRSCGAQYARGAGATIVVNGRTYHPREISELLPEPGDSGTAHASIRESEGDHPVHALGKYLGKVEKLGAPRAGSVTLTDERLRIDVDDGAGFEIPLLDITAIQPSSHALQIKARGRPVLSIRFTDSSPRLWEERLQHAVSGAYERAGKGTIVEFQPRICTRRTALSRRSESRARRLIASGRGRNPPAPLHYRILARVALGLWRLIGGRIDVSGLEHIPATGPFLILPNHQSYLETILVPAVIPRPTWAMAKSTQFNAPFVGWLMAQVLTFPVRRFEIDPQTVRFMLRRLSEGFGVVIYIEGERTWDGDVQALRHGVVRLAMNTGIPVIPCRVDGAFDAWPRWSSRVQAREIRIRFLPPLALPAARSRAEAEDHLESGIELIRTAISAR